MGKDLSSVTRPSRVHRLWTAGLVTRTPRMIAPSALARISNGHQSITRCPAGFRGPMIPDMPATGMSTSFPASPDRSDRTARRARWTELRWDTRRPGRRPPRTSRPPTRQTFRGAASGGGEPSSRPRLTCPSSRAGGSTKSRVRVGTLVALNPRNPARMSGVAGWRCRPLTLSRSDWRPTCCSAASVSSRSRSVRRL
jgi:hypothetical protein